jgi:DNA-binding GntR family transcriptional regulator
MFPWLPDLPEDDAAELSLAKRVRHDMLGMILSGQLEPGQRINEPDVAARLGISRVPVREALRELESSGLVVARKHSGSFVRQLQRVEVGHLYELRGLLDGHGGERAALLPKRRRIALVAALDGHIAEMTHAAAAHEVQRYHLANLRFHWALIEAADNPAFATSYQGVIQQLHVYRLQNLSSDPGMQASIDEHREIRQAVREGDAALARGLQVSHVGDAWKRLNT